MSNLQYNATCMANRALSSTSILFGKFIGFPCIVSRRRLWMDRKDNLGHRKRSSSQASSITIRLIIVVQVRHVKKSLPLFALIQLLECGLASGTASMCNVLFNAAPYFGFGPRPHINISRGARGDRSPRHVQYWAAHLLAFMRPWWRETNLISNGEVTWWTKKLRRFSCNCNSSGDNWPKKRTKN